ncbi:MAG: hypothetical protein KGR98_09265, partial [Verrucomicrobia bacterium]|nr:hypothetical protein [Verrucomicrobiota bacterium]
MSEPATSKGAGAALIQSAGQTAASGGHPSPGRRAWRRFQRNLPAVASAWFLMVLLAAVVVWPLALKFAGPQFDALHAPDRLSNAQFAPPSAEHWFGTDLHGRDV